MLGDGDWLAGTATPTIADLFLVPCLEWMQAGCTTPGIRADHVAAFPRLVALVGRFKALPGVVAWKAKRSALEGK